MNVNFDMPFWPVTTSILALILSLVALARSLSKAQVDDVRDQEKRMSALGERIQKCETQIHGYDGDDIVSAHKRLDDLQKSISKVEGLVEGMNANMKLLMENQMRRRAGDA